MKSLIAAAVMAVTLAGCIAVPVYGPGPRAYGGYYGYAPAPYHHRDYGYR
jgi:hypothetical protein